ncbi:MAG: hypothetical protein JSV16_13915, partial [Candidatus Hydrogenedentota bacterium]
MEYHELGIFFNLKGMSREKYVAEAWEVFMRCCKPEMLKNSHLFHGEGAGLLPGSGQMFCIAVRTADLKTIQYLKQVFGTCEDKRLASPIDRVRESNIVSKNRLKYRGKVDSKGRLETQEWSGIDHHLCMETEWPYCPHTRPAYLSEEQIRQLDWMSKGIKVGKDPEEKRSALRPKRTKDRRQDFKLPLILKRVVRGVIITSIIALSGIAWVNREKLLEDYNKKREQWKIRSRLSPEGYEKHQQGFAIVNISQIPPELPLKEFNERFAEKGYYVLRCGEESLLDASMDCSIWFSENRAGTDMITQGFISISMRDRNGTPLWTELAEGTIRLREGGVRVEDCRQRSMLAAINNLSLSDLLDGRAVRHYQDQGESVPSRAEIVSLREREREKKKLQAEILQCMSKQWIMSQR